MHEEEILLFKSIFQIDEERIENWVIADFYYRGFKIFGHRDCFSERGATGFALSLQKIKTEGFIQNA